MEEHAGPITYVFNLTCVANAAQQLELNKKLIMDEKAKIEARQRDYPKTVYYPNADTILPFLSRLEAEDGLIRKLNCAPSSDKDMAPEGIFDVYENPLYGIRLEEERAVCDPKHNRVFKCDMFADSYNEWKVFFCFS